jgi:2-iminoacetate synthase
MVLYRLKFTLKIWLNMVYNELNTIEKVVAGMLTQKQVSWKEERIEQIGKYLESEKRPDFIDDALIEGLIAAPSIPDRGKISELLNKAKALKGLTPQEAAYLMNITDQDVWNEIFSTAMEVKLSVYGNRIVLFAPLYISDECVNDCVYCGYRYSNAEIKHKGLSDEELKAEIKAMTDMGHKRIVAVYGEGPENDADYIAHSMKVIYSVKNGNGAIRRVNINAAPLFVDEYKKIKEAGIGTFQVFQETYNKARYKQLHGTDHVKSIFKWRLLSQHRAQEAGISDVAIGALFGIYDWKFEVMGLLYHAADMDREFGVGSHTISFPRLNPALNTPFYTKNKYKVTDEDMKKIIAILRISVPYTGLILTARENPELRNTLMKLGVSQVDAGSNIAIGGYQKGRNAATEQFQLSDNRTLDSFISELVDEKYIPSFCTADYRCGRVGCEFMELAKSGKIKNLCIPNAVLTFEEYLLDYASPEVKLKGERLLADYVSFVKANYSAKMAQNVEDYLARIKNGERDLYF